jgi:TolB-like protein
MRSAIIKSGRLNFVAGGGVRGEVRGEQQDQLTYASEATAVSLGNETGARLLLTGSVKSMVERAGNTSVRSYFVTAEMTNIETNVILWSETNSEIKKVIKQANYRF